MLEHAATAAQSPIANALVGLVVGVLLTAVRVLMERKLLPAPVMAAIKQIDEARIVEYVQRANAIARYTPDERREWVIEQIQLLLEKRGITVPDGYISLAVEYIYQRVIKGRLR